jgi:glutamyl-tRNA synthetase
MVAAFDIKDVNPNPARFDLKKAEAINASHMRLITLEDMTERVIPFLQRDGVLSEPVTDDERGLLDRAMPLVHERMNKLAEAPALLGFLFADEESFTRDEADAEKVLDEDGRAVVRAAREALTPLPAWKTSAIEDALRTALVEELGLKPRNAFGPVRVAVTGSRISPPLFESLELLGRERSLGRLEDALA